MQVRLQSERQGGNGASPAHPGVLLGLHTLGPHAQRSWHQHGHPEPAAADDEGHEQAEVMHGWDLSVSFDKSEDRTVEPFSMHSLCAYLMGNKTASVEAGCQIPVKIHVGGPEYRWIWEYINIVNNCK